MPAHGETEHKHTANGASRGRVYKYSMYSSCNFSVDSKFFKINSWEGKKKEYSKTYVYVSAHYT